MDWLLSLTVQCWACSNERLSLSSTQVVFPLLFGVILIRTAVQPFIHLMRQNYQESLLSFIIYLRMKGRFYSYLLWQVFLDMSILGLYLPGIPLFLLFVAIFSPLNGGVRKQRCANQKCQERSPQTLTQVQVLHHILCSCADTSFEAAGCFGPSYQQVSGGRKSDSVSRSNAPLVFFCFFFRPCFQAKCTPWISSRGVGVTRIQTFFQGQIDFISSNVRIDTLLPGPDIHPGNSSNFNGPLVGSAANIRN